MVALRKLTVGSHMPQNPVNEFCEEEKKNACMIASEATRLMETEFYCSIIWGWGTIFCTSIFNDKGSAALFAEA